MSKTILIVDDSAFMRNVLSDIVKDIIGDIQIDQAESGIEALTKCKEKEYDLILLDVIMSAGGGMDVLKEIGKKETIVVISAVGQTSMISEAQKLGAKDYIIKPFDNNVIKATLATYLE